MAQQQIAASTFDLRLRVRPAALVPLAIVLTILTIAPMAQGQTLTVLHTFTGGGDGGTPTAGLTIDQAGNFYGTTSMGGAGYGTVFKLSRSGTGWILSTLYSFQGGDDGGNPYAGVVFGPDGALYGTSSDYDIKGGFGTVFSLRPPASACHSVSCPWTKTVLYHFTGGADGANPGYGDLAFDAAGNIYGTTFSGGGGANCTSDNCGVVFQLSRSGGSWTESVLYRFSDSGKGGAIPYAGVILDGAGNLYGTTFLGGIDNGGVVFKLTQSGSSWTETVVHTFGGLNDGAYLFGGLIKDQWGNLYGTTAFGPTNENGGTVYELQPFGGSWTYSILAALPGNEETIGPQDAPTMDAAGNLYATSFGGGSGNDGYAFKLTPSGGSWIYTDLHDFNGQDGVNPSGVVLDAHGNLYARLRVSLFRFMAKSGSSRLRRLGLSCKLSA